eukprot:GHVH01010849.1.p1 GENE.GHVH01010849.1~~GHVH01010849.1.p1  ORF type:complete len:132 (+),score=8.66 GHVH01010849.1:76-471(+)
MLTRIILITSTLFTTGQSTITQSLVGGFNEVANKECRVPLDDAIRSEPSKLLVQKFSTVRPDEPGSNLVIKKCFQQIVNGTNFMVYVDQVSRDGKTVYGSYSVVIYRPLPYTNLPPYLTSVEEDHQVVVLQ